MAERVATDTHNKPLEQVALLSDHDHDLARLYTYEESVETSSRKPRKAAPVWGMTRDNGKNDSTKSQPGNRMEEI